MAQDSFYRSLYVKEVDFRSLSKQDDEFAAMYEPAAQLVVHRETLTRFTDCRVVASLILPTRLQLCNLPKPFSSLTSDSRSSYLEIGSVLP